MSQSRFLKLGGVFAALLMVFSLAAAGAAEARMGGSFGSRGMRTFSTAPVTRVAPNTVAPVQRSMTPNNGYNTATPNNGVQQPGGFNRGSFLSGLGGGIVGGLLGGLFFQGLFGHMMGFGFGGLGGGFSAIFQLLLIGGLIYLAFRLFRRQTAGPRNFGAFPMSGPDMGGQGYGARPGYGGGAAGPRSGNPDEIGITNTDFETFERMLGDVQGAFSREDHQGLRRYTTPEMVSYLSEELAENATHGLRNDVTDLKFLEGSLAESWREGNRDYATVAMHWSAIDMMRDRQTGAVVKGDPNHPVDGRELWTFVRDNGGAWQLSAIQDARN
ncbi:MAG TPA: TIM44-like domain-containing protein [Devosiaceae bacterium]|nr:TIM44-like domain-containing protein [Devosiaceae bacterium]